MNNLVSIKTNERILIVGKTGSGKTYLARHLTDPVKRLVVLDGKGTLTKQNGWDLEPWSKDAFSKLKRGEDIRVRVVAPEDYDDIDLYWDTLLKRLLDCGNLCIYIDEIYAIHTPGKQPGPGLHGCLTRGRELGVGVWTATQRPVWMPIVVLSEAEHFFTFRLSLLEDRQRMAGFMSVKVLEVIKDNHGFFYMRADWDAPVYIKQLGREKTEKRFITVKSVPIKKENQPLLERAKISFGG